MDLFVHTYDMMLTTQQCYDHDFISYTCDLLFTNRIIPENILSSLCNCRWVHETLQSSGMSLWLSRTKFGQASKNFGFGDTSKKTFTMVTVIKDGTLHLSHPIVIHIQSTILSLQTNHYGVFYIVSQVKTYMHTNMYVCT